MTQSSDSTTNRVKFFISVVKRSIIGILFFSGSGIFFGIIGGKYDISAGMVIGSWLALNFVVINIYMGPVKEQWRNLTE